MDDNYFVDDGTFSSDIDTENYPYLFKILNSFPKCTRSGNGWKACCTSASHNAGKGDNNPSLSLSIGPNGKVLVFCFSGCTTDEIVFGAGLEVADLFCPSFEDPYPQQSSSSEKLEYNPLLTEVYEKLLELAPIDDTKIKSLHERGFTKASCKSLNFGTIQSTQKLSSLRTKLVELFGDKLKEVPGFIKDKTGINFVGSDLKGLVIPLRDLKGRIVALKTRRPHGDPKYLLWSSPTAKAFTTLHFPLGFKQNTLIRITEGELKAELAQEKTKIPTISISGVNQWRAVLDTLDDLKPKQILIAFDFKDVLEKPQIKHTLWEFGNELVGRGFQVGIETWKDTSCKGIDDALMESQEIVPDWNYFSQPIYVCPSIEEMNFPKIKEALPFPLEILPPYLKNFVEVQSSLIGCPQDFIIASLFCSYARSLGSARAVSFRPGWLLLANLYMCIVGDPTTGKTPGAQVALKPLFNFQQRERKRFREDVAKYEDAMTIYKAELSEGKTKKALPKKPNKPKNKLRIFTTDVTTETLTKYLAENYESRGNASMLIFIDELVAWLDKMNKYTGGVGSDRQFYMSTYSNSPIDYGRKSTEEDFSIPYPSLTVLGGTQKAKLHHLSADIKEELGNDNLDDGFFSRMLFVYPTFVRSKRILTNPPPFNFEPLYHSLQKILMLRPVLGSGVDTDEYMPVSIPIDQDAQEAFCNFINADIEELEQKIIPLKLESSWSKHEATLAKLILILHVMELSYETTADLDVPIKLETVLKGIKAIQYFRSHLIKVYQVVNHDHIEEKIEQFIKSAITDYEGKFPFHDLYRKRLFGVKDKEDALKLCKLAELRGYGKLNYHRSKNSKEPHVFQLPQSRVRV